MPKLETRNRFYSRTWEANSLAMKFDEYMSYYKRKIFIKKFYKEVDWKLAPFFFVFIKN